MDNPISGRFVSGGELSKELQARRRGVVNDSVRAKSQVARDTLIAQKVSEGLACKEAVQNLDKAGEG